MSGGFMRAMMFGALLGAVCWLLLFGIGWVVFR